MSNKSQQPIKLRKHLTLGSIAAENDLQYLTSCFVDTGDYETLVDTEDDRSIILGRTGAGKSALLEMVKSREENVIEIEPEELALNYISHSNVINLLEECGVTLDPFYQLLWKHIFVVELLRRKFAINDEYGLQKFRDSLVSVFKKDKLKEAGMKYLDEWQGKFWLPVEERIKEITTTIESQLTSSAEGGAALTVGLLKTDARVSAAAQKEKISKLTKEEKDRIRDSVQSAVDSVQIQELHRVIKILGEDFFTDEQEKFYIVIDKIDETWVDDNTRFKLIRALIDTIKTFRKVRPVKFLLAMREDLFLTVLGRTRDATIQEDKYRDYLLKLRWTDQDLAELAEKRVAHLYRRTYEKKDAGFDDLFPSHVGSTTCREWFIARSLKRPRDLIVYMNFCLERATGSTSISSSVVRDSEVQYSQERLAAVCQEWSREYKPLELCLTLLKNKKDGFTHSEIERNDIEKLSDEILLKDFVDGGVICSDVESFLNKEISRSSLINRLMAIFYTVGIVGLKRDGHESAIWSDLDSPIVKESEVKRSSHFYIHPMFWRALGTNIDRRKA